MMKYRFIIYATLLPMLATGCATNQKLSELRDQSKMLHQRNSEEIGRLNTIVENLKAQLGSQHQRLWDVRMNQKGLQEKLKCIRIRVDGNVVQILPDNCDERDQNVSASYEDIF